MALYNNKDLEEQAGGFTATVVDAVNASMNTPPSNPFEGYQTVSAYEEAEKLKQRSRIAAAFRQGNEIVSMLSSKEAGISNDHDPDFDWRAWLKEKNLEHRSADFVNVLNARKAEARLAQIQMEDEDRKIEALAGPILGPIYGIAAGMASPTILIPGGSLVRGVKGGWSVSRSALMVGAGAAAGAAAQETLLQGSQQTRTVGESAIAVGGAFVLGAVIGGGAASVLSRGERKAVEEGIAKLSDYNTGRGPAPGSAGAAAVDDNPFVPEVQLGRDELGAGGGMIGRFLFNATKGLTPNMRMQASPSKVVRQTQQQLTESGVLSKQQLAGDSLGPAAETLFRMEFDGFANLVERTRVDAYNAFRKTEGGTLSPEDFGREIGRRLLAGEELTPSMRQAATTIMSEHEKKVAQRALKDGHITQAEYDAVLEMDGVYLPRVYTDKLKAQPQEFEDWAVSHITKQMTDEHDREFYALAKERERIELVRERVQSVGADRKSAIAAVKRAGEELDARIAADPNLRALFDRFDDLERQSRGGADVKRQLEALVKEGGEAFAAARKERSALRKEKAALAARGGKDSDAAKRMMRDLDAELDKLEKAYDDKWGKARRMADEAQIEGRAGKSEWDAAARAAARDVYLKITGQSVSKMDGGDFGDMVRATAGVFKERLLNLPSREMAERGWLNTNIFEIFPQSARKSMGELELGAKFKTAEGKPDTRLHTKMSEIQNDYGDMSRAVADADTTAEINEILGAKVVGKRMDIERAKEKAQMWLTKKLKQDIDDLKLTRDLIRGDSPIKNAATAQAVRMVKNFNYDRVMGGSGLASISDIFRIPLAHGLKPFFGAISDLTGPIGKLKREELNSFGVGTSNSLASLNAAFGDIGDPYISRGSGLDRLLQKTVAFASKWNGQNYITDFSQMVSAGAVQRRIVEGVTKGGDDAYLAGLNISREMRGRIKSQLEKYADGDMRLDRWDDSDAVRVVQAAVYKDVNTLITKGSVGDRPSFANSAPGQLITQFMSWTFAAHSRLMIRGFQQGDARFLASIISMTAAGILMEGLLSAYRGKDAWERFQKKASENPVALIGDGLDRSGFFALFFDAANRAEKITGAASPAYRFNPIKSPIAALGGGDTANVYSRGSDSSGAFGALLGPTASLVDSTIAAARVGMDFVSGAEPTKRDMTLATSAIPFSTYPIMRQTLQLLHGNLPGQ